MADISRLLAHLSNYVLIGRVQDNIVSLVFNFLIDLILLGTVKLFLKYLIFCEKNK